MEILDKKPLKNRESSIVKWRMKIKNKLRVYLFIGFKYIYLSYLFLV
jgi:hypothetical protein